MMYYIKVTEKTKAQVQEELFKLGYKWSLRPRHKIKKYRGMEGIALHGKEILWTSNLKLSLNQKSNVLITLEEVKGLKLKERLEEVKRIHLD